MLPTPREVLRRLSVPALLVTNLTNIRYLTGVTLSDGSLLVLPKSFILFADARYREMATSMVQNMVTVRAETELLPTLLKMSSCGFEQWNVTFGRLQKWKKMCKSTTFVPTTDAIEYFRRSKDDVELRNIRRAEKITVELLRRVPAVLKKGITERAVAWKIEQWARELGAEGMSFDSIVAFGTHTSRPHHHPTMRKLVRGMIVQIDIGVRYNGYCSDRSNVYFTGPIVAEQKRVFQAVLEAKEAAKNAIHSGVSTRELDGIARKILSGYGLERYFTHSLGHGVGLDIHEGVTLSSRSQNDVLLTGEVITVEPGVYIPGKFGIRLEDMVIVK
jgi:Xaa-Pro aminopeptidase